MLVRGLSGLKPTTLAQSFWNKNMDFTKSYSTWDMRCAKVNKAGHLKTYTFPLKVLLDSLRWSSSSLTFAGIDLFLMSTHTYPSKVIMFLCRGLWTSSTTRVFPSSWNKHKLILIYLVVVVAYIFKKHCLWILLDSQHGLWPKKGSKSLFFPYGHAHCGLQ